MQQMSTLVSVGGGNSCVTCQDSIKYFMGAFEDGGFIIVGLDTDGAQ